MPKKICNFNGCNNIIPYTERYCVEHKKDVEEIKKEKHKHYDKYRKDDKEWKFYKSKEWLKLREVILSKYQYVDLFAYYVENRLIQANTSHHIIEIKEDWNKRLDIYNQFPCSDGTHSKLHKMYKKDKKGTQELLYSLLDKWNKEMKL